MKNGTATLETPVAPALPNLDEPLFEIVNGEKVEMPPMGAYSTMLAFWLGQLLDSFARPRALGNVAVEMLFGMCNSLYHWYDPNGRIRPQALADQVLEMVFGGLRPR